MNNKEDASTRKRQAFKSFLETNASPNPDTKKNASDNQAVFQQQYVEQLTSCNVCGNEVPDAASKKKNCGFCQQVACLDHLRKRRKKKNKWQKICDSCQDKFLYDNYMKLEIKAQQSLAVEQQIVSMKYDDAKQVLENKRIKRRELSFFSEEMNTKYDQKMMVMIKQDNRYQSLNNRLESDEITCSQIQEYISRMQNKIKSNYEQDYRILTQQDERLGAELARIEKKCSQVRSAIQKRQKELEQAYERWQRKQFGKVQQITPTQKAPEKQPGCFIF